MVFGLSTEKFREGDYRINDGYFIRGLEGTYVQKVLTSPVVLQPGIVISTPLLSPYGEKLGVFAARLDLDRMDKIFMEKAGLGRSGEAYLVDKFNILQPYPYHHYRYLNRSCRNFRKRSRRGSWAYLLPSVGRRSLG